MQIYILSMLAFKQKCKFIWRSNHMSKRKAAKQRRTIQIFNKMNILLHNEHTIEKFIK